MNNTTELLIARIRTRSKLSISDITSILNTDKKTLYSWINQESEPTGIQRLTLEILFLLVEKLNQPKLSWKEIKEKFNFKDVDETEGQDIIDDLTGKRFTDD